MNMMEVNTMKKENIKANSSLFSLPQKSLFSKHRWREIDDKYQIYFQLQSDGNIEVIGKIKAKKDIPEICSTLAKRLGQEFEVKKKYVATRPRMTRTSDPFLIREVL